MGKGKDKGGICMADGGITRQETADELMARMSAKYGAPAAGPVQSAPVQQSAPQPVPKPQAPQQGIAAGIRGMFGNRQQQLDEQERKANGMANGGLIQNAAEYWQNDNAEFEKTNPNVAQRIVRGVNPMTGFGSAMGAMKTAAEQGSIPGMGMALIQGIPAAGVMRVVPAAGAVKASVAPSMVRTAVAAGGGAVANAAADDMQQRIGYANGGIVRGKGTPTSDDVPVKIKGEDYNLSDTEAVLPSKTRQALGEMLGAKPGDVAQANKLVEAFIEKTNGKPPVSVEEGTNLADGGLLDEEARKMNYQAVTGTPTPAPIPAPTAAPAQPTDGISLGKSPAPTIYGNGGLPPDVVERGINTMRGQLAKPQSPAPAAMGPAAVQAQTVDDGAGGVYTPGGGAIPPDKAGSGILNGIVGFFEDSARAARGEKSYEQLRADRSAGQVTPPTAAPAASMNDGRVAVKADPFGPKPEQFSTPANSDGTFMTGKDGARPDSSGGGFVQKDVAYNVNPTNQEGITKITSSKTNPLYTNGRPEDAVAGLNNQSVGAQDVQEGLNRHARANAITQSLIDKQPAGGVGILGDGGVSASNDEKTARWRQDELLQQAKYGNRAAGDAIQANAKLAGDQIHSITSQRGQDITARGHDVHAQTEADRLAGNPVDNQLKKAQTRGILAQSASNEALAGLQERAIAGDQQALASYRALTGKGADYKDRYITLPNRKVYNEMGQIVGEEPGGIFDAATGQPVQSAPAGKKGAANVSYEQFAAQMNARFPGKANEEQLKQAYAKQFGA